MVSKKKKLRMMVMILKNVYMIIMISCTLSFMFHVLFLACLNFTSLCQILFELRSRMIRRAEFC